MIIVLYGILAIIGWIGAFSIGIPALVLAKKASILSYTLSILNLIFGLALVGYNWWLIYVNAGSEPFFYSLLWFIAPSVFIASPSILIGIFGILLIRRNNGKNNL